MLPRGLRLTRDQFPRVAQGKRAISAHFSVSFAASETGRAAAVVSKKVAKRSVDRHTLKRRMLAASLPFLADGRAFVVYARAGSLSLSSSALRTELSSLLKQLPKV
jgi:ribonuclease P protein component